MRTREEIRARLETVLADERLGYKTATVRENAPLALIQLELETQRDVLRWVLDETRTGTEEPDGRRCT